MVWIVIGQVSIIGQTFRATPVSYRDQQLTAAFKSYQVYELPITEINKYVHKHSFAVSIKLVMGNEVFDWTLYENTILSPEARGTTKRDGSYVPLDFNRACRTYIGYSIKTNVEARFTISEKNFIAMIPDGENLTFVQPIRYFDRNANPNLVVLFKNSDIVSLPFGQCATPHKKKQDQRTNPQADPKNNSPYSNPRTFSCRELQVSFATDNQMWQEYEDVDLLLDFNLTVLNVAEPFFDDFDLDFIVDDFFMVTDPANAANPWGQETDVNDLIDDFGDWADSYFSSDDIGHLWSNHDLHNDGDYGTIGRAYIGGTCGDIGIYQWAVLERFSATNFYDLALLQAHEYGHLLDAEHAPGTGTIMEPSLDLVEASIWHQANIDEMNDFMEDEDCIQSCIQCPLALTVIDYISWGDWKYSTLYNLHSTAVIDSLADVIFQSEGYVKLSPGFSASSLQPSSANGTFVAKIAGCE